MIHFNLTSITTVLFSVLSIFASAQVQVPFTQRTSASTPEQTIYSIHGDFTMIGNSNMTLQNYTDTKNNSNNNMVKVDKDGISSTNNSSSATLVFSNENGANPECSRVLFAGLYWSARTSDSPTTSQKKTIKFRGPGESGYTTYTATSSNIRYPGDNRMYVGFVEVTSHVQQRGSGEYWVADMALSTGDGGSTGYYGGWGLVVVYENSLMVKRDITIFDGYAYVIGGDAEWELPVSGFNSALVGDVNLKLGLMAGEGDVGISGDQFAIQKLNTSNFQLLSHGGNSENNFFNSSIFTGGNARNPNVPNNTGMDISMFTIPNPSNSIIANNQSQTKFRYSSTQDTYIIYSICMAVDAYEPVVEAFLSTQSINGMPADDPILTAEPGDEIQYKVEIRNRGNEPINNTRIEIPLPYAAVGFQGTTVNVYPPASSATLPYVDAGLGANGTLVWDFGTLPVPVDPDDVLAEIIFSVRVSEDCNLYYNFNCSAPSVDINGSVSGVGANTGVPVNDQPFYVGYSDVDGCTAEPVTGPFVINVNATSWVAANCPPGSDVRDFQYCNRTTPISITEVMGFYPGGTRFFNTDETEEFTITNPFPNVPGPTTYYAVLPGESCILLFTIQVTNVNSVPTVTGIPVEYCQFEAAVPLTAVPSNPSYTLFYYSPGNPAPQPSLTPPTNVVGEYIYKVAEGPSSTCISTEKADIPVHILSLPTLTATPEQILCFGGGGSVALEASGGTGSLSFSPSNPPLTGLPEGSYLYEVADSKGCTASATAIIGAAPAELILEATPSPATCALPDGSVTLQVSGGTMPYIFDAGNPATSNLLAASYSYGVEDANGCRAEAIAVVESASQPSFGSETAEACYSFFWNGNTYTSSGEYMVVLENAAGCDSLVTLYLTIADDLDPQLVGVPGDLQVECDNVPDAGHVSATDNCDEDVEIDFSEVVGNETACGYTITRTWTATDDYGNSATESQEIVVLDATPPVIGSAGTDATINCPEEPVFTAPLATDNCDPNPSVILVSDETDRGRMCRYLYAHQDLEGCRCLRQRIRDREPEHYRSGRNRSFYFCPGRRSHDRVSGGA
jgi:uncharacterized repeat protein (TIGR01451 family)